MWKAKGHNIVGKPQNPGRYSWESEAKLGLSSLLSSQYPTIKH